MRKRRSNTNKARVSKKESTARNKVAEALWKEKVEEKAKETFLPFGKNPVENESYPKYNYKDVNFLFNGEIVEYKVETIPTGTTHSFHKYWHVIIVLTSIVFNYNAMKEGCTGICQFGIIFWATYIVTLLTWGLAGFTTYLFIGARFRGHTTNIYMGFIGVVIYQYLDTLIQTYDTIFFLKTNLHNTMLSAVPYFPFWKNCLPRGPKEQHNLTQTLG